jgi:hypothetical protein
LVTFCQLAGITDSILIIVGLIGVGYTRTVVAVIRNSVAISVAIAAVTEAVCICVPLIRIGLSRTVVAAIRVTVSVSILLLCH